MIPPDPVVITKTVDRIVQVRCEDTREPAPDFPTDEDFRAIDPSDPLAIWTLSTMYRAALRQYRARLAVDDAQIAACSGG